MSRMGFKWKQQNKRGKKKIKRKNEENERSLDGLTHSVWCCSKRKKKIVYNELIMNERLKTMNFEPV